MKIVLEVQLYSILPINNIKKPLHLIHNLAFLLNWMLGVKAKI